MPLTLEQKKQLISSLQNLFEKESNFLLFDLSGLDVEVQRLLRRKFKLNQAKLLVAKKTLLRRAWHKILPVDTQKQLEPVLEAPVSVGLAIGAGSPEILPKLFFQVLQAQGSYQAALIEEKILGGLAEGRFSTAKDLIMLARLPGRRQLQGRLLGTLQGIMAQFLSVLQAPSRSLIVILQQKI
jgi:large subunit ribosomal protein L10